MQENFKPTRILIPTDFSSSAQKSVEAGTALALEFQASVFLLHVIPLFPESGCSTVLFQEEGHLADAQNTACAKLGLYMREFQAKGIEAAYGTEVGNDTVGNIMMVLSRERADLLVISTHGVSGWRPLVFGSIAEQVIKLAECPLLLLRTAKPSV